MYWLKTSILLSVIYCYCVFVTAVRGLRLKNADSKCTHGGILSGVFLNGGIESRNDTIFSNIPSMDACIEKCCKISKCDLAMKIGQVCHAVKCQDDDSCQISHRRKGAELRAEISFITKGEEVKISSAKDLPKSSFQHQSTVSQQSIINKRPTTPVRHDFPKTNPKHFPKSRPTLFSKTSPKNFPQASQKTTKNSNVVESRREENYNIAASGSGSGSKSEEDEDEESGSGLISSTSEEYSGINSPSSIDGKETNKKNLLNKESKHEPNYVLPDAIHLNAKLPSSSRSAIPTPSELNRLNSELEQSFKSYSNEAESPDISDTDNSGTDDDANDSMEQDETEDDDDDEESGENDHSKSDITHTTERSNKKTVTKGDSTSQIHRDQYNTVVDSSKGVKKDVLKENIESDEYKRGSGRTDKADSVLSNFAKNTDSSTHITEMNRNKGNDRPEARSKSKRKKVEEAQGSSSNNNVYDFKSSNIDVHIRSHMRDTKILKTDAEGKTKGASKGKMVQQKTAAADTNRNTVAKDYNDVNRGIISVAKKKKKETSLIQLDMGGKQGGKKRKAIAREMFSAKATKSSLRKKKEDITPLQKQLSTLLAKDMRSQQPKGRSFYKTSKKSSFEKIRKIQQQREKKRRNGKDHSSLYQFLNVPKENAKCKRGVTIRGATLRGGILAGDFKTVGIVTDQHSCVSSCCKNKRCDVALMLGKECFNVKCYSNSLCGIAPATAIFDEVTPIITYVRGHIEKRSIENQDEDDSMPEKAEENMQLLKWLKIFI